MNIHELLKTATQEQRQRAFQCKTAEELGHFAKEENIGISVEDAAELFAAMHTSTGEISDNDLDNIAGGKDNDFLMQDVTCPNCGHTFKTCYDSFGVRTCSKCGHKIQ